MDVGALVLPRVVVHPYRGSCYHELAGRGGLVAKRRRQSASRGPSLAKSVTLKVQSAIGKSIEGHTGIVLVSCRERKRHFQRTPCQPSGDRFLLLMDISKVEGACQQHDAHVCRKSWPEVMPEDQDIHSNDDDDRA